MGDLQLLGVVIRALHGLTNLTDPYFRDEETEEQKS